MIFFFFSYLSFFLLFWWGVWDVSGAEGWRGKKEILL